MRLVLFLFLINISIGFSQVITVCASGCSQTTMAAAYAAAGATSIIQVNDNSITNETLSVNKNIAGIQGANPSITWGYQGASATLGLQSGITQPFFVKNIIITHNTANANTVQFSTVGAGASITFTNVTVSNTLASTAGSMFINAVLNAAGDFTANNCNFNTNGNSSSFCFRESGAIVTTGTSTLNNCLLNGNVSGGGVSISDTSANVTTTFNNCSFVNCATAFISTGAVSIINGLFLGNATDLSLTSPAVTGQFTYTGFGQASSGGTSCITGLTSSREWCDKNNFWISSVSQTKGKGVSITGLTKVLNGFNGLLQGYSGNQDMGCNPYSSALCSGFGEGK